MPRCKYCKQPTASWFARAHPECESTHKKGLEEIRLRLQRALFESYQLEDLQIAETRAQQSFVSTEEISEIVAELFPKALNKALEDHVLTEAEILVLHKATQLLTEKAHERIAPAINTLKKATILAYLQEGRLPNVSIQGSVPFILQKGEQPVWVEENVPLYEYKTERSYVSSGFGISVRIAKGVYLRPSQHQVRQVVTKEFIKQTDRGLLLFTNKNIYFGGAKLRRIPLNKVVGLRLFKDGVEVHMDGTKSKPLVFGVNDPVFIANLINALQ